MDSRAFWNVVQSELDRGRDPLDRPVLAQWLEEHPEEIESFADLRAGLALVAAARQPRWRVGWPLLAAAAVLAALGVAWHRPGDDRPPATVRIHRLTVTFDDGDLLHSAASRPGRHTTRDELRASGTGPLLRLSVRTDEEHTEEEP